MPEPRVPVSLSRRHREALERVAASLGCPTERLIDEAVEHHLRRLGVTVPRGAAHPDPARHADAAWTSVLR